MLDHGRILADGIPSEVAELFYARIDEKISDTAKQEARRRPVQKHLQDRFEILSVVLRNEDGQPTDTVHFHGPLNIAIRFEAKAELRRPVFAVGVDTTDLLHLAAQRSERDLMIESLPPGQYELTCCVREFPLLAGVYSLRLSVTDGDLGSERFYGENLAYFRVASDKERADYQGECFLQLEADWGICRPDTTELVRNDYSSFCIEESK
jgi:hypothetical protein